MRNRPTADELGQEYAKLEKAHAEAVATYTAEFAELIAAIDNALKFRSETSIPLLVQFQNRKQYTDKRLKKMQKELDKVKKKAQKWYGIAL